jgi:putative PIN family toxin of toxin-antitoxin system
VTAKPICGAVFDCNVFLQTAANPESQAAECVRLAETGLVCLFISAEILIEISEVLRRPKILRRFPDLTERSVSLFLERVVKISSFVKQVNLKFRLPRDVDDEPYINLAIETGCDYIVSNDKDLLDLMTSHSVVGKEFRQRFRRIRVVNPPQFVREIRNAASNVLEDRL